MVITRAGSRTYLDAATEETGSTRFSEKWAAKKDLLRVKMFFPCLEFDEKSLNDTLVIIGSAEGWL